MNISANNTQDNDSYKTTHLGDTEFAVVSSYICLVGMLGFVGNSWVIIAFCRYKNLRTSTNVFIVHLAGCDLLLASMDLVFSFPSSLNRRWLFGSGMCETIGFAYHFLNAMSLNTLALISLDRYWVIAKPSFGAKITVKRAVFGVFLTYLYTFVFTLPVLFGWVGFHEETYFTGCYLNFNNKGIKSLSSIATAVVFFFVPFGVMVYCYYSIFLSVRKRSRRINLRVKDRKRTWKFTLPHWRTARMIVAVIFVFILCWSPHVVISLCVAVGINISPLIQEVTLLLAKSGIIYNPFIYAVMNYHFKNAFLEMLCQKCKTHGQGKPSRTPAASRRTSSFRISHASGSSLGKTLSERFAEKEVVTDCVSSQCQLKRFSFNKTKLTKINLEQLYRASSEAVNPELNKIHNGREYDNNVLLKTAECYKIKIESTEES